MSRVSGGLPALAVAVSAILWGLWWLPLRWLADRGLPGDWASLVIYAVVAALLLPLAWVRRERLRAGGRGLLLVGILLGAVLVFWNHAVLIGEVVRVVLLFYLAPVWATLLALAMLKERIGALRVLSVGLGLGGAAIVLGFEGGLPLPRSQGDWLGLLSGFLFALGATFARKTADVGGFEKTFVAFAGAAALAVVLVLAEAAPVPAGRAMLAATPPAAALALLWIFPGTWLVLWGATRLDPGRVSILLLLEVVTASVSASLLTDEPFGWREAGGCVLIGLAGLVEAAQELRRDVA